MTVASQLARLAAAYPTMVRFYSGYWDACKEWGVALRDIDMRELVTASGATLDLAVEAAIAKAKPEVLEDLF